MLCRWTFIYDYVYDTSMFHCDQHISAIHYFNIEVARHPQPPDLPRHRITPRFERENLSFCHFEIDITP